jgi:hypothetical protein
VTAGPSGGLAIEAPGDEVALGGVEVLHGIGMELAAGAAGTAGDAPANQASATPISGIHAWTRWLGPRHGESAANEQQ